MKSKFSKPHKRFDLVRRKADGKIIKWELKRLSELGILPDMTETVDKASSLVTIKPAFDHEVWVVTGVFNHRREAFA